MKTETIMQSGDHIPQLVNGAPAPVGLGQQLFDSLDQTRCTVADDQPGRAESAAGEVPTQIEPVLVRFSWPRRTATSTRSPGWCSPTPPAPPPCHRSAEWANTPPAGTARAG